MNSRLRLAQAAALIAAAAVLLPWQSNVDATSESIAGNSVSEGRIVLVVCLITIGLVQVGWRPAWIGPGFAFAVTLRAILKLFGGDPPDPAIGLWVTAVSALAAVGLLAWNLFASVSRYSDSAGDDKPQGRGMSGPLGRRQR